MKIKRNAQSTLEFMLLFTAIIAFTIYFLVRANSPYQQKMNQAYSSVAESYVNSANSFFNSF